MAFGLPVMTTAIVMGSMYAGHIMTVRSDRPTNVLVSAAPPSIDVNVPTAAPPNVQVSAPPATVDVHVPQSAPPVVTVNPATLPAPNINITPPAPTVTVIEREPLDFQLATRERFERLEKFEKAEKEKAAKVLASAASSSDAAKLPESKPEAAGTFAAPAAPKTDAPATSTPAATEPAKSATPAPASKPSAEAKPAAEPVKAAEAVVLPEAKPMLLARAVSGSMGKNEELSIDTLYACAEKYIETYCKRNNLDPVQEEKKWNRMWKASVEQAISDNIDSSEQSYINRMVIAKRDYFNIERATPEKIVEACRIMLRYRDGQLAWLSAMREALTQDNLKKTVAFLSAGPK
ncbi:MAG TPA: hypothetical protein VEK08_04620 [Planctomycetota bacterium]|nr:hypothetical protein [Planctomycetota bacterium]